MALEAALFGPFGQPEPLPDPVIDMADEGETAPVEPMATDASPAVQPPATIDDAPEFPFDSPASPPIDLSAAGETSSESSGPFSDSAPVTVAESAPAQEMETSAQDAPAPLQPEEPSDPAKAEAEQADAEAPKAKTPLPGPLPVFQEISGHWLPADLRALRRSALVPKRQEAEALMQRLEQLRNRVGDRGRVPRR